jgi:hypothetical protein
MNDPAPPNPKITRLGDLPRDIPPPHDGWPALEAMLRESGVPQAHVRVEEHRPGASSRMGPVRRWRPRAMHMAALAAVLAAVVVGISVDRWILSPVSPSPQVASVRSNGGVEGATPVAYVTDPRYLRERATLLRSLNARLAKLPPPTRKKVLASLATIEQSMHEIQQALGREPGNALLQELLIDTYQNEMQLLSTVEDTSSGSGET